ncbi:MAG: hypothetical protein ACYC7A_20700 [Thermoanaerobaculia bacterium]
MRLTALFAASILITTTAVAAETPATGAPKRRVLKSATSTSSSTRSVSGSSNVSPLVKAAKTAPKAKAKIKITKETLVKTGGRITTTDSTWTPKVAVPSPPVEVAPPPAPAAPVMTDAERAKKAADLRAELERLSELVLEAAESAEGIEGLDDIESRMQQIPAELEKLESPPQPDGR